MPIPHHPPSRELQQRAWDDLRAHGTTAVQCHPSLDATLQAGGIGAALVNMHAHLMAQGLPRYHEPPPGLPAQPGRPPSRPGLPGVWQPRRHTPTRPTTAVAALLDHKRRASGERDDD